MDGSFISSVEPKVNSQFCYRTKVVNDITYIQCCDDIRLSQNDYHIKKISSYKLQHSCYHQVERPLKERKQKSSWINKHLKKTLKLDINLNIYIFNNINMVEFNTVERQM